MFCCFKDIEKEMKVSDIQPKKIQEKKYILKSSLMTNKEKQYFNAILIALNKQYILQPQVNLATIIKKESEEYYQTDLYRNIDFCIFDFNYKPLLLIEINDETHYEKNRQARDYKVKEICKSANIPLITFWTNYGINQEYITNKIKENLK